MNNNKIIYDIYNQYNLCSKEENNKLKNGKQYIEDYLYFIHNNCKTSIHIILNTQKNLTSNFCAKLLYNYNFFEKQDLIIEILQKQKHISFYEIEKLINK